MSKKLIIPNREASYTDEQYTNIVKQSIKEQRPYLDDEELSSLATFKMGSIEPPKSVSKPIEAEKPKTFTQLAKSIKAEKPQPFKSTTEMVDKFVPKQEEPKLELADPNKAAATARMLDKFIPTQPKEAPMELVGKDFAPEAPKQASTLNKIAPNVQQVTESNAIPNPQIQSQENQSQAEDIRQQLLAKKNNVGKPFFGEEELPLNEALQPKENGSILNVEPKRDNVQISTKDKFDEDAENALPKGSANEKIVYAETLRQNDGKIDMFNAKNIAKILPDEDFRKLIDFKSLTNTYKKEGIGDLALAAAKQAIGSEEDKSVEDYLYSQDFKERVIKESKGVPQNMGAAAEYIIANKKAEFKDAPSAYQRKMQEFSDWAAANNKPLYVLNKANTGMWQGVANVGQLIGGVVSGTIKTAKQLSNNESADYMSNVYEGVDKAGKHLSRVVPIADSQKGDAATRGIGDVVQMVTEIGSSMGVVKSVSPFTKIKNFLSLGKNSEAIAAKGLGLEAQLAVKAQSNANKGLIEIAKILQSKPSNTVAKILDNTVNNYIAMGAPTMIGQRQKYIDMGFTEEQAERRASGMTFLNMLALSLPNVLRPHEMSIMEKVFNKGNFKEGALSSVKQGRNFFVDMTAIRLAEEQVDESAKREMGIPIERKSFGEKLTEITEHGLKDLTAGIIMGGLGRMKYKQSDMQLAGVAEAFNNPEALNQSIKNSVKSGKVSKEDAVAFQTFLNTLKPEYDKAVTEARKDGTPKFAPAIAAKVAIERTKQKQAEQTLKSLENSVEKWKTYETDKDGKPIEKILYRHSDGKMYDYEEAKTLRQRNALVGAVMDARKTVAQLESGQYVKGKLVSANQMKAIVEMNSLNGEAKKGQLEAIDANAPYENVEFEVVDFANQPEIAKIVEEIKASGEVPTELPSVNDPILNEKGEVVEGRTQVAHAIVRGGGKISFMKPLSPEKAKEATNIALGDKLGETEPITEGLGETDIIAINEAKDVYNNHLESNEGDFDGALKSAARDLSERQYTADETKDMLKRLNGENSVSEAIVDAVYRDKDKVQEPVSQEITNQDARTELESIVGRSESENQQSEGTTSGTEQSDVRAVEANKEGQEAKDQIAIAKEKGLKDMSIAERMRQRASAIQEKNTTFEKTKQNEKASEQNADGESGKSGSNISKNTPKGKVTGTAKKRAKATIKNPTYLRALDVESPDATTQVMQYFIRGGRVSPEVIKEMYKNSKKELDSKIGFIKRDAPTLDGLAHSLWQEHESMFGEEQGTTTQDFKNAIEDVLNSYSSRSRMAEEVASKHIDSYIEREYQELEEKAKAEAKEYEEYVGDAIDLFAELTEEQVDRIIAEDAMGEKEVEQTLARELAKEYVTQAETSQAETLTQKEKQLVKEEAKLSKLQQSLEVVGKENQFDIFGGKPSDSMLFETSVSDAEKVYKAQKKVVDALKTEISEIKDEIQTAKDSEVTANQIAMELPTSKLKQASSFIRDAAAKLREQHQKDLDDPNTIQRQGGLSKKQVAIALEKIADIIDAVGDVEKAIKQFLEGIKDPKERLEYEKEINNFFLEEYGESSPKSEPKEEKTTKEFIEEHKGEMVERTLLSQRLKPSNIVDSVKQFFSDYENSMREIDSHEKADLNAARLIQDVGMDEAVRMAKDGEIQGAFQSAVLGAKWLEAENNIKAATTPEEIAKAEKEYSEILKLVGKTQEQMGGANSYWGTFYSRNENLGLTTADKIARWEVTSGNVASEKIREAYEKLDAENKENLAEIKRLREEAEKFQVQEIIDEIKDRAKRNPKAATQKAKELADNFRETFKSKPIELKDAEGNPILDAEGKPVVLQMQGLNFNQLIEVGAKAIEKTGEIIDGIKAISEKLAEQEWYKALSKKDKEAVIGQITKTFEDNVKLPEIDTSEPLTTAVLKELVEKGFDTPEKLFEKVKEFFPKGTSDRKIRDSITKYGQPLKETQTEIGQKVSAIKSIWAKISQLDDVAKGKLPFRRNPPENKQFRDERRRKMNELREAMKNLDAPEAEMEDKWKTRIETAKNKYKNAIADYEKAIKDGEVIVNNKAEKLNDKDIEELKRELELIKDAYNEVFGEEPMSEGEKKIQALEKQLEGIGKERAKTENVEPEYTASEINDIEILEKQIEARRKAVKMEGATLKTEAEKNIEKLQKRLDDIRFGAEKRTSEKRELSQEEKDLVEQIKDEKAKQGTQKAKRTSEQIKIDAIDAAIDRVESLIKNNDLEIKENPKGETSLSLKAKREAYEATKKGLLEARKEAGIIEKEQLRKRAEYLKKRIEYYEERKKKGDYSKKERKKSPINDEINRLLGKNDVLKFEEQKLMHLAEEQAKDWYQKRLDNIADIWNIPRIQMATGEFSFMGVQGRRLGASYFLKNPKALKEAVQTMLKSFASDEKLAEAMSKIKNDDPLLYHAMKVAKLDITEASYKLKAAEENTQRIGGAFLWKLVMDLSFIPLSKGVSKVSGNKTFEGWMKTLKEKPFYENFERAAVGYNNFLRVKAFADFTELMRIEGKNIENSEKEFKIFANYLNTATGRGKLGVLEPIAEPLAKIFFSPRNFSSEFQLATTPFGVGKLAAMQLKSDTKLKNFTEEQSAVKEALKHQIRYTVLQSVVAIGATWLLYKNLGSTDENEDGTGVELDPRSTKFGTATFKDGKTVDFFSGGLRYLILASRIRTQEYKTADRVKIFNDKAYVKKGEVKELGEGYIPDALGLITQIAANKVNPSLGAAYTLYTAEPKTNLDKELGIKRDRFGRRVSVSSVAKELTAPIFWNGVVESAQNDPSIVDGLGQLAAFFAFAGYRVQNKEKLAREEQEQVKKDRIEAKQKRIEEKQKRPKYRF